jgi:glucose-1-phosphate cytidylyltransferase
MKVAILAGGFGSRIAEETEIRPKPMVEIGGHPILWHIMRLYAHYGFKDFVIALGYKGDYIKKYFADYCALGGDVLVDFRTRRIATNGDADLGWTVNLVETGTLTNTGGRIKRLAPHVGDATFMLTWGDGVSNIDLRKLLEFHRAHGKLATLSAVRPPARYGHLDLDGSKIVHFSEKPQASEGWINGAFFVLEPKVIDYIDGDSTQFEREPLERLARDGQLMAYRHESFWQCMDTLREKHILQALWDAEQAPWKVWE